MTNPKTLDEAVQSFRRWAQGGSGFDELDFKEWLIESWYVEQVEAVLDRLEASRETAQSAESHLWLILDAIDYERNKLKEGE